ncbi:hypothetical protein HNP72_001161 [Sphingobacterium soli]|nr:hypothetical protein [Sphingobacterium soli]
MLRKCIQTDLECAEICESTYKLLLMRSSAYMGIVKICMDICNSCAEECEKHAAHGMEHCRECAEACRSCAASCEALLA